MVSARMTLAVLVMIAASAMTACANLPLLPGAAPEPDEPPVVRKRFPLPPPGDDIVGEIQVVIAGPEDTLHDIARHFDLGYNEITAANPGVDPWLPGEGTAVVVPTQFVLPPGPRQGIVVNIAAMRLFYFPEPAPGEQPIVVTHPIGVGRVGWPTPTGGTRIVSKVEKPTWYVPESIRREHAEANDPLPAVVPPGPDNPLGDFAMRLGMHEYLIHGTNKPFGIGMRISHGCIRLYPEDIEPLFSETPIGTPVRHAPFEEDLPENGDGMKSAVETIVRAAEAAEIAIDRAKASRVVGAARGYPLPISPDAPDADAVVANARRVLNPLRSEDEPSRSTWESLLSWLRAE